MTNRTEARIPLAYYEILVRLSEAPGRALRMTQLAAASASSKSRVSHAVARIMYLDNLHTASCHVSQLAPFHPADDDDKSDAEDQEDSDEQEDHNGTDDDDAQPPSPPA